MRFFSLIFYYLPLFFFTLSIAPNYTSESINLTLISVPLVYVSLISGIGLLRKGTAGNKWLYAAAILVLGGIFTYLNSSHTDLLILACAHAILFSLLKGSSYMGEVVFGSGLLLLTYLGITGFEFGQLLKMDMLMYGVVGAAMYLAFPSRSKWNGSPLLYLVILALFMLYNGHLIYFWGLLLAFLPMAVAYLLKKEIKVWVEAITILTLLGFYLYYTLFSTYLIQALQGGM